MCAPPKGKETKRSFPSPFIPKGPVRQAGEPGLPHRPIARGLRDSRKGSRGRASGPLPKPATRPSLLRASSVGVAIGRHASHGGSGAQKASNKRKPRLSRGANKCPPGASSFPAAAESIDPKVQAASPHAVFLRIWTCRFVHSSVQGRVGFAKRRRRGTHGQGSPPSKGKPARARAAGGNCEVPGSSSGHFGTPEKTDFPIVFPLAVGDQ